MAQIHCYLARQWLEKESFCDRDFLENDDGDAMNLNDFSQSCECQEISLTQVSIEIPNSLIF
jgi:hypothetical protein